MGRHRSVSDADWNQLITLASGYLALESGDIQAAMQRALAAHMDLISALKAEQISAEIDEGRVTMFVPDDGGVALRLEQSAEDVPLTPPPPPAPADDEGITEISPQLDDMPTEAQYDASSTYSLDEDE